MRTIRNMLVNNRLSWTLEEIDFLRANWQKISDAELAKKLKRTEYAVHAKRQMLRLLHPHYIPPPKWDKELLQQLSQSIGVSIEKIKNNVNFLENTLNGRM